MAENIAIVNDTTGLVQTIVRGDGGAAVAPEGYHTVPESELPAGWEMEPPPAPPPVVLESAFPSMTKKERDDIENPPDGAMVFQTDGGNSGLRYYDKGWKKVANTDDD